MIKSFRNKETEKLFRGRKSRAVPPALRERAELKLRQLNRVKSVQELTLPPGNHLHKLGGKRSGQWAISINGPYRVCFRFEDGNAEDVEVIDYH